MQKEIAYSVVIPVYLSQETLSELIERTIKVFSLQMSSFEIILVNDGSPDNSWQVIEQLKTKFPGVIKGINLTKNYGQQNATLCGVLESAGRFIITMDDDLQVIPEDIPLLIEKQKKTNADLVYGKYLKTHRPLWRKIARWYYKLISIEEGSSFRLINGRLRTCFADHRFHFVFIDELCVWYTNKIVFVPVSHAPSQKGRSTYSLGKLWSIGTGFLVYSANVHLKLMVAIGFIFSFVNALLGIYFVYRRVFHKINVDGYTSLIVSVLFSTGVIMFCMGLIGFSIHQMYKLNNRQPSYNIDQVI